MQLLYRFQISLTAIVLQILGKFCCIQHFFHSIFCSSKSEHPIYINLSLLTDEQFRLPPSRPRVYRAGTQFVWMLYGLCRATGREVQHLWQVRANAMTMYCLELHISSIIDNCKMFTSTDEEQSNSRYTYCKLCTDNIVIYLTICLCSK